MPKLLWKKLAVGTQTSVAYRRPNCVLCCGTETMSRCKFWPVTIDVVTKAFRPVWSPTGLSLQTTQDYAGVGVVGSS